MAKSNTEATTSPELTRTLEEAVHFLIGSCASQCHRCNTHAHLRGERVIYLAMATRVRLNEWNSYFIYGIRITSSTRHSERIVTSLPKPIGRVPCNHPTNGTLTQAARKSKRMHEWLRKNQNECASSSEKERPDGKDDENPGNDVCDE
jgi:hypothetical protein